MKIAVIIPFVQDTFINVLLSWIAANSVQPDKVFLIDNSAHGVYIQTSLKQCEYIHNKIPMSVNGSWNYGFSLCQENFDLIAVLNDDLLIEKYFFEKNIKAMNECPSAGVVCPTTTTDKQEVFQSENGFPGCIVMRKREGWAWTIRSELAKKIPTIPCTLKTWCGDDWYWHQCQRLSFQWIKVQNNLCFHYVGQSVRLDEATRLTRKIEKALLRQALLS